MDEDKDITVTLPLAEYNFWNNLKEKLKKDEEDINERIRANSVLICKEVINLHGEVINTYFFYNQDTNEMVNRIIGTMPMKNFRKLRKKYRKNTLKRIKEA